MYSYYYNTNVANVLQTLLISADFSDLTLAVEGKLFKAHRAILSMYSPYLKALFYEQPTKHAIFFMKNVPHRIMKYLLEFMYVGKIQIPEVDLNAFMETAKELMITELSELQFTSEEENSADGETTQKRHIEEDSSCVNIKKERRQSHADCENEIELHDEPSCIPIIQSVSSEETCPIPRITDIRSVINAFKQENEDAECMQYNTLYRKVQDDHFDQLNDSLATEENRQEETVVTRMMSNNSSLLEINGHIYYRHKDRREGGIWLRWRCARCNNGQAGRNCRASVRTNPEDLLIHTKVHTHPPPGPPPGAVVVCRERYKVFKPKMDEI